MANSFFWGGIMGHVHTQVYARFVILETLISSEVFLCSWKKLNAEKFVLKEKQHE